MVKINFQNNITKCNAETFNTMQDNIEDAIDIVDGKTLDIYSTTETRIGTWIDGKPIYRKIFTGTITSVSNFSVGTISNFKEAIKIYGTTSFNNYATQITQFWNDNIKIIPQVSNANGDIVINAGALSSNQKYILIIEYTKTTD